MGRHRSNLDVGPPASGVWKERPSWVETVLSGATVLILVLGLLGLVAGAGSIVIAVWAERPELLISAPALFGGGIASLLYATFVGIGWELLKRLRELRNGLTDILLALREVRSLQRGLNFEVSELSSNRDPEPPPLETAHSAGRAETPATAGSRISAFLEPEPPPPRPERPTVFVAEYRRSDGTLGRREVPAPDSESVRRALEERGHTVMDIRPRRVGEAAQG